MEVIDDGGRQERGLMLAQAKRIKQIVTGTFYVPSQNSNGGYVVDVEKGTCSCPDHELRGLVLKCKHRWAIEYVRHQVTTPDGSQVVTGTMRVTYKQNWPLYNRYQCEEKDRVRVLLHALCSGIRNPVRSGRGRPRMPLADVIYAATMKTFVGYSGRRSTTDVNDCLGMGFLDKAPAYNTVFDYLERPELTPLLMTLIQESATPIAEIDHERAFGLDSTGFSTQVYRRWFDHKYGKEVKEATWVKLHISIGVRSKIITAAVVTDGTCGDSPQLPGLLETTAQNFNVKEVLADKGYIANENLEAIAKLSATPYIPFKSNAQGAEGTEIWKKAFHAFAFHREEFLRKYHLRSNVEGTFSSIKRKFGPAVRARDLDAQCNEALLKVLCHNLSVLVRSIHELGLDPVFWKGSPAQQLEEETP
jgi:hypothetical protein